MKHNGTVEDGIGPHATTSSKDDSARMRTGASLHNREINSENIRKEGDKDKLIRCIKNCAFIENDVGEKECKFRTMQTEMIEIVGKKENIDKEIENLCEKISTLELKNPNYTTLEFREVCYLKHRLVFKMNEKSEVNKRSAELTKKSALIKKQIFKNTNDFKSFVFEKQKLLAKVDKTNK